MEDSASEGQAWKEVTWVSFDRALCIPELGYGAFGFLATSPKSFCQTWLRGHGSEERFKLEGALADIGLDFGLVQPLAKGNNTLEVTLTERDSAAVPEVYLRDVELEIKYLMGKNFNRGDGGQDLDLGEYEFTSTSYRS